MLDDKDQTHHMSIYRKTLSNDRYDYAKGNSTFFDSPVTEFYGLPFLSYTIQEGEIQRYAKLGSHFDRVL